MIKKSPTINEFKTVDAPIGSLGDYLSKIQITESDSGQFLFQF